MDEKYDEREEHQLRLLAENRIQSGQYKIFDQTARVITRKKVDGRSCLVIISVEAEMEILF